MRHAFQCLREASFPSDGRMIQIIRCFFGNGTEILSFGPASSVQVFPIPVWIALTASAQAVAGNSVIVSIERRVAAVRELVIRLLAGKHLLAGFPLCT